ncbi:hypothetical protein CAXC1_210006 [Candidatus Xenohaliotis californiensis]|uniref:Uncharacterized protein n=1 Tax=Candidatus Xenohaliotis californiensis TaxID=84677 RepID=A0ABP0EUP3_9RICK|nr:hypothetical protein CAXC1_210006 [Candidatus Xenohaliotis californiensis]
MTDSGNNMMIAFKNNSKDKNKETDSFDIVSNPLYIRRFAALLRDVMQRGSDLMHLANGNVVITETKVVTYQYAWNKEKGKFERAKLGARSTRSKKIQDKDDRSNMSSAYSDIDNYYYGDMQNYDDSFEINDNKNSNNQNNKDIDELV